MDSPSRDLAEEFGWEAVWKRGLATLGYPPTWVDTTDELIDLRNALL
jgi:hypothetical protein